MSRWTKKQVAQFSLGQLVFGNSEDVNIIVQTQD